MFIYLQTLYIRNFFIVIVGLQGIYTMIDFIQNQHKIPESANMQILYIYFSSINALSYTLPLTLVLALIISLYSLLAQNKLLAFSALGFSKKNLVFPFLSSALAITLLYIGLNFTGLAYAKERADAILENRYFSDEKDDILLNYKNFYIYFGQIFPLKKEAENIKIYSFEQNRTLNSIITAKRATYNGESWILKDAIITQASNNPQLPIIKTEFRELSVLQGFKPKIIDAIFERELKLSVFDAIASLELFETSTNSMQKIKTLLYYQLFFPFFAPFIMVLILYYTPILRRFQNINKTVFLQIIFSLGVWGVLFSLMNLGLNGVINPELAVIMPIFGLFVLSTIYYNKLNETN